jgi:hypothetical protein
LPGLSRGLSLGTREAWNALKVLLMPRRKATDQESILGHPIIIRVTETTFNKLEEIRKESDYQTIGEVARKILSNRKIKLFYQDISMNGPMEELALIRKELKAIGININQITRSFNSDKGGTHRAFYVLKAAEKYQEVDAKVDRLLTIISQLAEKWLQKS